MERGAAVANPTPFNGEEIVYRGSLNSIIGVLFALPGPIVRIASVTNQA